MFGFKTWLCWYAAAITASILFSAESCFRHQQELPPAETTTYPTVEMVPEVSTSSANTVRAHRVPCARHEINRTRCLQGSCTAVIIVAESRTVFCSCFYGFEGLRCEFKTQYPYISPVADDKTVVAAASVVLTIIIVAIVIGLVICCLVFYVRRRAVGLQNRRGFDVIYRNGKETHINTISHDRVAPTTNGVREEPLLTNSRTATVT